MATWIVGLVLVGAVYFAAKHILKTHKSGGCVGCPSSGSGSCCCHCETHTRHTHIDLKKDKK